MRAEKYTLGVCTFATSVASRRRSASALPDEAQSSVRSSRRLRPLLFQQGTRLRPIALCVASLDSRVSSIKSRALNSVSVDFFGAIMRFYAQVGRPFRMAFVEAPFLTAQLSSSVRTLQNFAPALAVATDQHAIGVREVADGRAFAQEFRIRAHREFGVGPEFLEAALDLAAGADRHGRVVMTVEGAICGASSATASNT